MLHVAGQQITEIRYQVNGHKKSIKTREHAPAQSLCYITINHKYLHIITIVIVNTCNNQ